VSRPANRKAALAARASVADQIRGAFLAHVADAFTESLADQLDDAVTRSADQVAEALVASCRSADTAAP